MFFVKNSFCVNLSIILYFQKKIEANNRELEGVFNNRYKAVKTIGAGAQGTVYEVEDLTENRKR